MAWVDTSVSTRCGTGSAGARYNGNWPSRALAAGPKLLVLDEPTEGIQPNIIKDIGKVIRMLADRGGMAIVLVEQYDDFVEALADHYVVMVRGEVIVSGPG